MLEPNSLDKTDASRSNVVNFYTNRSVFITGGTGFLGKALIEKLLRSCPNLNNIYILVRAKRNKHPEERFQELFKEPVFDLVSGDKNLLKKVKMIGGDVAEKNLGMSKENLGKIIREVSIVFHVAATIKFDELLKVAVNINLVGTKNIVDLCHQISQLAALVHVSTTFANCELIEIDEHIYPANVDPETLIEVSQKLDQDIFQELKSKLIISKPNTYTYTKAQAEWLLFKTARDLPVVICRPSIIVSTWKEPFAGWIDNMSGTTGAFVGLGKGLTRSMLGESRSVVDFTPVDTVTNLMISLSWFANLYQNYKLLHRTLSRDEVHKNVGDSSGDDSMAHMTDLEKEEEGEREEEFNLVDEKKGSRRPCSKTASRHYGHKSASFSSHKERSLEKLSSRNSNKVLSYERDRFEDKISNFVSQNRLQLRAKNLPEEIADVPVFHCSSGTVNPITWAKTHLLVATFWAIFPSITTYRCPNYSYTSSKHLYTFHRITLHYIPAYIMDFLTNLFPSGAKCAQLVRFYKNNDKAEIVLTAFTSKNWKFNSKNRLTFINEFMSQEDKSLFNCDISSLNWSEYLSDYVLGMRKFILKEPLSNLADARRRFNIVYYKNSCLQLSSIFILIGILTHYVMKTSSIDI